VGQGEQSQATLARWYTPSESFDVQSSVVWKLCVRVRVWFTP
jgi:hypothetical protein